MSTTAEDSALLGEPRGTTDDDEVFLRQQKTYSDLSSSSNQIENPLTSNPALDDAIESTCSTLSRKDLLETSEKGSVGDRVAELIDNAHELQRFTCDGAFLPKTDKSGTGLFGGKQSNTSYSDHTVRNVLDKIGDLMLQPSTSGIQTEKEFATVSHEDAEPPQSEISHEGTEPPQTRKAKKRPLEFSVVSRAEHKRWRQEIDGFVQYSEWVAKVNESRYEEMPEIESSESITSYDPAEEYFFHASIPLVDDEGFAEINKFVDRINKKIDEQEKEIAETDANLQNQKKMWDQREEWDPFLAEKLSRKKKAMDETKVFENIHLFICFACGRAFDDEKQMRDHVNSVHLSKQGYNFKCSKCYRRFKTKHHLVRHERTHDESAVFRCDRCSSSYRRKDSLKVHQSRVHHIDENGQPIETLDFACSHCKRRFGTPIELSRHKYICAKNKRSLELGIKKESLNAAAAATVQPKASTSCSSPRPLLSKICHVCQNKFASTQSLIRHIGRKHPSEQYVRRYEIVSSASTPNLPFACLECQKRFATTSALSLHKRRHMGDCPHQCDHCGRKYPIASELRKHIRRTHEKRKESGEDSSAMECSSITGAPTGLDSNVNSEVKEFRKEDDLTEFTF